MTAFYEFINIEQNIMKVAIKTLGCKVNQSESASIEGTLREDGHEVVKYTDNPDVCVINTCTVTAKSDYQSRQFVRRAIRSGARVIATGCYAQLMPDELSKIEGLDLIIGNSQKDKIQEYVNKISQKRGRGDFHTEVLVDSPDFPLTSQLYFSNRSRAFLKIQDGCNFSCSYCTVPMARGKCRSLGPEDVLKAVDKFSTDGYKEIVLTGIHIGSYGLELQPESSLLKLVDMLTKSYPQIRFRLSSIEPQEFKKEFLTFIKDGSVCLHLHIPLQSGSDKILKAMNRRYSVPFFRELIYNIVKTCPDISIGSDVIVGFPGESAQDFEETVKFVEELPITYLHVFPYSKRSNTKAALFSEQITGAVKKKRVRTLLDIGMMKKNTYLTRQLGHILDVIVERKATTDSFYSAISNNYIKLLVHSDSLFSGQRLQVKAISLTDSGLITKPLN